MRRKTEVNQTDQKIQGEQKNTTSNNKRRREEEKKTIRYISLSAVIYQSNFDLFGTSNQYII